MDERIYHFTEGGWTISNGEDGYTLHAQFFCRNAQAVWPKRGDSVPASGSIAVPSAFAAYRFSEVQITPLTVVGPYILDVTARPRLGFGTSNSDSLRKERKATLEMRPHTVRRGQLQDRSISGEYTFEFLVLDFYENTGTGVDLVASYPGPVVTNLPEWCDVQNKERKWKLFSCVKEKVYDTNGVTLLKHIRAELIGVPDWLGTRWPSSLNTIAFSSL